MTFALPSRRPTPAWVRDGLWRRARAVPSLDLRFADGKSLVDAVSGRSLVTFTRSGNGSYVGSDGLLKTATTNEPRFDYNPLTGESLGLLVEEQRSNLLLNSETLSTQSVTVAAVAHTLSFTGTGTITLSGASTAGPLVGTGTGEANRVSLPFTPTAGTLTLTVSGTVSNAQLEAGAFRTSYIPTTSSAATRNADVVSITGANFSSWYRQNEGTLFSDASLYLAPATNANPCLASMDDGTSSNRMQLYRANNNANPYAGFVALSGGVLQANINGGISLLTNYVMSGSYVLDNFALSLFGRTPISDTSATVANVNQLTIGSGPALNFLNGTIRRLTYWPARLPNSTLQALTQ